MGNPQPIRGEVVRKILRAKVARMGGKKSLGGNL